MTKIEAQKKTLEQAFWQKYPTLSEDRDYTFEDLFPSLNQEYFDTVFFAMVQRNELPLIGVIPLMGSCDQDCRVALYFH